MPKGSTEYEWPGTGLKRAIMALAIIAAVILAVLVGKELTSDAVGVVIGAFCGVAAGVPTSLMVLVARGQAHRPTQWSTDPSVKGGSYPPVVVLQGGSAQGFVEAGSRYGEAATAHPLPDRRFHMVSVGGPLGDDESY